MAKDKEQVVEQNPQQGGSFIRNADGSLTKQVDVGSKSAESTAKETFEKKD